MIKTFFYLIYPDKTMKYKSYIQTLKWNADETSGFTLIELLVAAVIMAIVMTLAGSAFVTILQQNQKAEGETQARQNLNRALDYIANEVRRANNVQPGAAAGEVFQLTIPNSSPAYDNTLRFTRRTALPSDPLGTIYAGSTTSTYSVAASTGVWAEPNDPTPRSVMQNSSNFLVNNIQAPVTAEINRIRATCPNPTGAATNPNFRGDNGFYACIHPSIPGRTVRNRVDLFLYGRISNNRTSANSADDEIMLVETTVYTRTNGL